VPESADSTLDTQDTQDTQPADTQPATLGGENQDPKPEEVTPESAV
jgi:hypothetical protein